LFGHVRGAFTGAVADKTGKFQQAHQGTVFLDEIGTMPLHLQMKMLRVLQEQEVEKVGSSKKIKLDVRVISATNANLEQEVERGRFRADLYYRLNVIPITLPALRERREDIALLARYFLQKTCNELNRPLLSITPGAMSCLENYHWPGNVRELENVIERTVTLTEGLAIGKSDLPANISGSSCEDEEPQISCPRLTEAGLDMPEIIANIERCLIRSAMDLSQGVKARAAELLNIKRTTLVEKIKRLNL
jgi:transcriptional regulator with PAS, ATPase and Fis domain